MVLLLILSACSPAPASLRVEVPPAMQLLSPAPESDPAVTMKGRWRHGGREVVLEGHALRVDEELLADGLYALPAFAANRLAWAEDEGNPEEGEALKVATFEIGGPVVQVLARGLRADRLALDPAGENLAFVAAGGGLASLWVVATDGSARPRQLTNVDLPPARGGPPPGWIAPPRAAPRFDGDFLVWDLPVEDDGIGTANAASRGAASGSSTAEASTSESSTAESSAAGSAATAEVAWR